jgi:competence protein ComEC
MALFNLRKNFQTSKLVQLLKTSFSSLQQTTASSYQRRTDPLLLDSRNLDYSESSYSEPKNSQESIINKKYLSLRPIFILLGLLVGIFLAKYYYFEFDVVDAVIAIVLITLFLFGKSKLAMLGAMFIFGLVFGLIRGENYHHKLNLYNQFYGQKVAVSGVITDDPTYTGEKGDLEFNVERVDIKFLESSNVPIKMIGRVRIRTQQFVSVHRGDYITASGKINKPLGNRQGSISYASIDNIEKRLSLVERLRQLFFKSIYTYLPEPEASLGLGFLLGTRNSLPDSFNEKLNRTGLTHIVAVSGYNLTIIVEAIRRLMGKSSRKNVVLMSLFLIGIFMLFTGMAPSIARAAIVSVVSLLGWYYGRKVNPLTVILISAGITAYLNPLYIWLDLGWWLSVLAFTGVLILAPLIGKRYFPKLKERMIPAILIETFSAQLLTLPLILSVFGRLSIISIPANLIIVPFIPIAMLFIFLNGISGIILPIASKLLSLITSSIMVPIVWAIEKLSAPAWAQTSLKLNTGDMLLAYLVIFLWIMAMTARVYDSAR